jgi:hypothetical protein
MRMHWLSVLLVVFAMTSMMPVEATACVTKSGKDCDTAAAHKVVYTKKLIKLAPAGGVGKKIHSTGFDTLGTPTFRTAPTAPPDPQQYFGTNPDGWFYLMPSSQHTGGFFDKPMPHQVMAMISANAERTGGEALVNQDGSLTQYALNIGWERTGSAVPFAVTQPAPTTIQSQPAVPQYQPPVPRQVQTPPQSLPVPLPNAVIAPTLLPGHAANGPARAHPEQHVEVYHPTKAGIYRYSDAHKIGDSSFHLVVIGFKEPE